MSIKLLILAFKKAEKEIGSSKKTHLAQHLSDLLLENYNYSIHERTLRDYYTNYKNDTIGIQDDLKPKLIVCFCNYLGYKDYAHFVNKNQDRGIDEPEERKRNFAEIKRKEDKENRRLEEERKRRKRIFIISISASFGVILLAVFFFKYLILITNKSETCMTWANSAYIKVSCDEAPLSQYGTQVMPLDRMELKSMRKVEVDAAYPFFSDTNEPLVWYYKNKDNEHEFFTAPGFHPTTRKTLRKITPYIIQTYVPVHVQKKSSFVQ